MWKTLWLLSNVRNYFVTLKCILSSMSKLSLKYRAPISISIIIRSLGSSNASFAWNGRNYFQGQVQKKIITSKLDPETWFVIVTLLVSWWKRSWKILWCFVTSIGICSTNSLNMLRKCKFIKTIFVSLTRYIC